MTCSPLASPLMPEPHRRGGDGLESHPRTRRLFAVAAALHVAAALVMVTLRLVMAFRHVAAASLGAAMRACDRQGSFGRGYRYRLLACVACHPDDPRNLLWNARRGRRLRRLWFGLRTCYCVFFFLSAIIIPVRPA